MNIIEMIGIGSKWGPYIRSLRMRILSTDMLHELKGTMAGKMMTKWLKGDGNLIKYFIIIFYCTCLSKQRYLKILITINNEMIKPLSCNTLFTST